MNKSSATKVGESTATLPQTAADASTLAQTFTAVEEQKNPLELLRSPRQDRSTHKLLYSDDSRGELPGDEQG